MSLDHVELAWRLVSENRSPEEARESLVAMGIEATLASKIVDNAVTRQSERSPRIESPDDALVIVSHFAQRITDHDFDGCGFRHELPRHLIVLRTVAYMAGDKHSATPFVPADEGGACSRMLFPPGGVSEWAFTRALKLLQNERFEGRPLWFTFVGGQRKRYRDPKTGITRWVASKVRIEEWLYEPEARPAFEPADKGAAVEPAFEAAFEPADNTQCPTQGTTQRETALEQADTEAASGAADLIECPKCHRSEPRPASNLAVCGLTGRPYYFDAARGA